MESAGDVPKVLAYVVRPRGRRHDDGSAADAELLVHEHRDAPEAGLQVPAGTIEPGETPVDAARRELWEEAGLRFDDDNHPPRLIRVYRWHNDHTGRWNLRHVFLFVPDRGLPDRWEHVITGHGQDRDMVFAFRWMPLPQAARELCGDQGGSIDRINNSDLRPTT
jgi:8-oxo-dGTP pyrophosphatase MutT (NUDIX family)